ncbi:hypothetical protein PRZ48_012776 [Zasmidium cellare]|uniref:Uncharacterized protein n=1 Tax=Zasmidium cellare TaxID=395010 RepID=A0ABR0E6B1_ZASCE|nr:hypothetical protein PRZ48_012776 [Zasmidium cellare]
MRLPLDNIERAVDSAANGLHQITRTLVERSSSDDNDSSGSTCKAGDDSPKCVTPASVQNTQTIAIVLGVVIPLGCAVVVLIFLHRRHLKKQKQEDLNDPHKSLDFGMDGIEPTTSKNGKRKGPEMTITEVGPASGSIRRNHGMSMDMNMSMGSPYLLPAGLQGSRESIHSMSRSMMDEHDPYRPVTMMRPSTDNDSMRFGRANDDKGSLYSMSTGHHSAAVRDNAGLIANARPMSQSMGKRADSMSPQESHASGEFPPRQMHSSMNNRNGTPSRKASVDKDLPDISESFPTPPAEPEPVAQQMPPRSSSTSEASAPRPPRKDSMSTIHTEQRPESSNYGDEVPAAPAAPIINEPEPYDIDPAMIYYEETPQPPAVPKLQAPPPGKTSQPRLSVVGPQGNRLSVMGMRPLPPEITEDNPEVRANRIRSFYKEYFDDSKPNPSTGHYYDDDDDYNFLDGVVYDPDTGGFFAPGSKPFAQGPGRRAMTPPPRGKPRVSGNSTIPHQRKFSTLSAGRPRGRSLPRKKLPPPMPLTSLPTPHMLKEDAMVFNPIDFAPPTSIRELQNGRRPDSPLGIQRPYSPSVRAFTPLASSFDNLAVLPSPHDLRRSGTFTALDFAPPSKIRDPNLSPSDAGSIRSNRSGISAVQRNAVRDGAYRVSRIPKEMVTTKEDINAQLRPKMDMISRA